MADLKKVYAAIDEPTASYELDSFDEKWGGKYPKNGVSWRSNWPNLCAYFKYPEEVRKLIYTTNAIEGFNRQLRKVTKSKSVFPTDDSLLKMLYLAHNQEMDWQAAGLGQNSFTAGNLLCRSHLIGLTSKTITV